MIKALKLVFHRYFLRGIVLPVLLVCRKLIGSSFEGAHLSQIRCLKGAHLIQIVKCLRGAHLSQIHGLNFKGGTFDSNPKMFEGAH